MRSRNSPYRTLPGASHTHPAGLVQTYSCSNADSAWHFQNPHVLFVEVSKRGSRHHCKRTALWPCLHQLTAPVSVNFDMFSCHKFTTCSETKQLLCHPFPFQCANPCQQRGTRAQNISKRASNQHEIHIRFHSLMGIRNPNLRLRHHVSSTKATSQPIARQWLWFKKMLTLVSTCRGFALMSLFAPCTWINSYAIIMFIENMWLSNYQTLAPLKSYGSKDLVHTDLIWINDFQVSSFIWPRLRTPSVWLWKSANIKKTHSNVSNQIISSIKPLTYKLCRSKVPTKLFIFNFFYLFDSSFKR